MNIFLLGMISVVSVVLLVAIILYVKSRIIKKKLQNMDYFVHSKFNDINFLSSKVKKTG